MQLSSDSAEDKDMATRSSNRKKAGKQHNTTTSQSKAKARASVRSYAELEDAAVDGAIATLQRLSRTRRQ
jgi:hypothetical protein